jgi:hypothetical protein
VASILPTRVQLDVCPENGDLSRRDYRTQSGVLTPGPDIKDLRPESTSNPAYAGCNSDRAQYSSTPKLHHSAHQDSRTTTTRTRTKRLRSGGREVSALDAGCDAQQIFCRPFRAGLYCQCVLGLKPQAQSYSPFGTKNSTQPKYLSTFSKPHHKTLSRTRTSTIDLTDVRDMPVKRFQAQES